MNYDSWKLRAPEDEPGYWTGRTPDCGDVYERAQCRGCGLVKDYVDVACSLCPTCHDEVDEAEARVDLGFDE